MQTYNVGQNKPIKFRVRISVEAHAVAAAYLKDENGKFPIDGNAFTATPNTGWKQLNSGNEVKNRTLKVRTVVTFPQGVDNEDEFDKIVENAKETYEVSLSGGTPNVKAFEFEMVQFFSVPIIIFTTLIELT